MTLEQLMEKLNNYQPYQAMTQEEMNQTAQNRYQALYDQKRLTAKQAWETNDQALERELAGIQATYDRERLQTQARTEDNYRAANRQALTRGMQRSSYNNANLSNIRLSGDAQLAALGQEQAQAEGDVNQQRTLLSRQLSGQLAEYDAQQQSDMLGYLDELETREYDRSVQSTNTHNELAMKLYEYQHQLEVEAAEQARWQAEFNAKYGGSSGRSSGSGRKTTAAAAASASVTLSRGGAGNGMTTQRMLDR